MSPKIRIRFATADDVSLILTLIRGLAEYERLVSEAVVTAADIRDSLFGERPAAEVLIAEGTRVSVRARWTTGPSIASPASHWGASHGNPPTEFTGRMLLARSRSVS